MMAGPVEALDAGLYSKLAAGTALTTVLGGTYIYDSLAPLTKDPPFVIFQWQGGGDTNTTPRRSRNVVYTVKGVATSKATAADIDEKIDDLLHNQTLTISGWTNFWMAREGDVRLLEVDDRGQQIWHVGGMYRIRFCE